MRIVSKFKQNFLSKAPNTKGNIIALGVVLLCFYLSFQFWHTELGDYLAASQVAVFEKGEIWRLWTSSFIHGDLDHFLSNSLMLFILTLFVTNFYGFKVSVLLAFGLGGLINFLVLKINSHVGSIVGASGVVYLLWGFWLVLYFFIQRQLSWAKRLLRVGAVFFILLIPTSYSPQTSYLAHALGFVLGVSVGLGYYLFNREHLLAFEKWETKVVFDEFDEEIEEKNFHEVD